MASTWSRSSAASATSRMCWGRLSIPDWRPLPSSLQPHSGDGLVRSGKTGSVSRLGDAADGRAREAAPPRDERERGDGERLGRCADQRQVAVAAQELEVGVDVVIGGDRVEDEVEAAG